jgi:hypothetical protein
MYQNRMRRRTSNLNLQSLIRTSEIAVDPRAAYVDSVCRALIESRFGPGYIYEPSPVVITRRDRPEPEPVLLSDLLDDEPNWQDKLVPFFTFSRQGRAGSHLLEGAFRRAKQMGFLIASLNPRNSEHALTPNLARGSP